MVTVAGGKWTTYRRMAEGTLDFAIQHSLLSPRECVSRTIRLHGAPSMAQAKAQLGQPLSQYGTDAVCVRDSSGRVVTGARLSFGGATAALTTGGDGCVNAVLPVGGQVTTEREGFATARSTLANGAEALVVLEPGAVTERVEVTAARTPLELEATASSVRVLGRPRVDGGGGVLSG